LAPPDDVRPAAAEIPPAANTEKQRGRPFEPGQSGNPNGRPKNSRNRVTKAVEALDGHSEALVAKAVEMALAGDSSMVRALVSSLMPRTRDRTVEFNLPKIETTADACAASAAELEACSRGRARVQELGSKWHGWAHPIVDPITVGEQRDIDYLKKHYPELAPPHPFADTMKAFAEAAKKHRAQDDEWLRLRLERKKAAAAARASSQDDASSCLDAMAAAQRRRVKAEVPTIRPRIINDEDDVDWESIDYDDDY
jgi:hypothetical protein